VAFGRPVASGRSGARRSDDRGRSGGVQVVPGEAQVPPGKVQVVSDQV